MSLSRWEITFKSNHYYYNIIRDDEEAKELIKQYEAIKARLDKKAKDLDDYMVKYNELVALYGELDQNVQEIRKNFKSF